jgi:hypothetical protein
VDGRPLEADIKLDDYAYGRFVMLEALQYYSLSSATRGVHDHSLSEIAFRQDERRFQVIWLYPPVEGPVRGDSR